MDMSVLVIGAAVVVGVLAGGLVLFMLNRSWGNFPTEISYDVDQPARPAARPNEPYIDEPPDLSDHDDWDDNDLDEERPLPPEPIPNGGLILITNPLLLQAIERVRQEDHPSAQYIVTDGDDIYLSLDAIPDATQRRQAAEMVIAFQNGDHVGVWDMIKMINVFSSASRR